MTNFQHKNNKWLIHMKQFNYIYKANANQDNNKTELTKLKEL